MATASSSSRTPASSTRQSSFEDDQPEDEFMQYYRQYRPGFSSIPASPCSSEEGRSKTGGGGGRMRAWQQAKKKLMMLAGKSKSAEETKRPISRTPVGVSAAAPGNSSISGGSNNSTCSPLGGLPGMLDKMNFNSNSSSQGDDSQSRDSGHSSGGSPDLRGVRKRRGGNSNGQYHYRNPHPRVQHGFRDWHHRNNNTDHQRQNHLWRRNNNESAYSYRTAMIRGEPPTYIPGDPMEGLLEHSRPSRNGNYDNASVSSYQTGIPTFYDSQSVTPSSSLDSWCPPSSVDFSSIGPSLHKRKLDCLREDVVADVNSSMDSPCKKKLPCSNDQEVSDVKPKQPGSEICSRFLLVLKVIMVALTCCVLLFLTFFLYRKYRCDGDRQTGLDIDGLAKTLEENLFGQHIAADQIVGVLRDFAESPGPSVHVLILTGWLGSGKTFTTSLIREAFPISDNTHVFSVPVHFAKDTRNLPILDDLSLHVGKSCGHTLVIFDDIDSGSKKTLEQVEKFVRSLKNSLLASRSNGTLVSNELADF